MKPTVWLLLGHKAGDNNQVRALAETLGWSAREKRMRYRPWELLTNRLLRVTLAGLDRSLCDPLEPPWPDLIITAGRRNEPVARWIRKQSGGRTRLVHLGRSWAHPSRFDLVVTTPQYQVPPGPEVLLIDLPLHLLTHARLEQATQEWAPVFAELPRPLIAVFVGGTSGHYVFSPRKLRRLASAACHMARDAGGSLLVSTSARTPAGGLELMQSIVDVPAYWFGWDPDARLNPYLGFLAHADAFVVTGESMSMLTEACFTGKPVHIFDPGEHAPRLPGEEEVARTCAWWRRAENLRWRPMQSRLALALAPRRMRRDVGAIQRKLVQTGRAAWLGEEPAGRAAGSEADNLAQASERVRALFGADA